MSNDDGTPKAVASTAGSSGFIKGAYSVTGSPNGPKERSVVHARTKLFYFRNQTITRNDISAIIPYHEPGSAVFQNWETQIIKWRNDLQKNIWDGAWFLNFVRTRVDEYDATTQDDRHATLTGINRSDFWAHESRLSRDTIFKLFSPLSSSVDLDQVWEDAVWNKYVRRVYTVACISIWRNRIKEEHGKPA